MGVRTGFSATQSMVLVALSGAISGMVASRVLTWSALPPEAIYITSCLCSAAVMGTYVTLMVLERLDEAPHILGACAFTVEACAARVADIAAGRLTTAIDRSAQRVERTVTEVVAPTIEAGQVAATDVTMTLRRTVLAIMRSAFCWTVTGVGLVIGAWCAAPGMRALGNALATHAQPLLGAYPAASFAIAGITTVLSLLVVWLVARRSSCR